VIQVANGNDSTIAVVDPLGRKCGPPYDPHSTMNCWQGPLFGGSRLVMEITRPLSGVYTVRSTTKGALPGPVSIAGIVASGNFCYSFWPAWTDSGSHWAAVCRFRFDTHSAGDSCAITIIDD